MAIYKLTKETLIPLQETQLAAEGIFERRDLQRLLRNYITVLDPDLMVISEEFSQWVESTRRIDLLCIDKEANLVAVELKRTDDGGHMELQAIRYAAMVSTMTFNQLVDAHRGYLENSSQASDAAEQDILTFLQWGKADEELFASDVRIILAAADFSKELTTSVLWLNDHGLDIRCIRLKPYRDTEGAIFLDVQQLIPLPEATEYQTQIKAKEQAGRARTAERYDIRHRFWSALLNLARTKTDLHANRNPGRYGWIGGSIGKSGFNLNYAARGDESQVELYIDLGRDSEQRNLEVLRALEAHKTGIETAFGGELEWQELPGSRACRIRKVFSGGYRSLDTEWPRIHEQLIEAMIRLDRAIRPFVQNLDM